MISRRGVMLAGLALLSAAACARTAESTPGRWATGTVTIDGSEFEVRNVSMEVSFEADGYYSISGDPASRSEEDCVPGLSAGMALYGSLPASVHGPEDLIGQRLPVEFSGDGDDANLCFVGLEGLLGAEEAFVTIDSVAGGRAEFRMSGSFQMYDEEGGVSRRQASARGTAQIAAAR